MIIEKFKTSFLFWSICCIQVWAPLRVGGAVMWPSPNLLKQCISGTVSIAGTTVSKQPVVGGQPTGLYTTLYQVPCRWECRWCRETVHEVTDKGNGVRVAVVALSVSSDRIPAPPNIYPTVTAHQEIVPDVIPIVVKHMVSLDLSHFPFAGRHVLAAISRRVVYEEFVYWRSPARSPPRGSSSPFASGHGLELITSADGCGHTASSVDGSWTQAALVPATAIRDRKSVV